MFSGLQQIYAHGLVIDGDFGYVCASTDSLVNGTVNYGLDALFIKMYMVNASVTWMRRLGGPQEDSSGILYRGSSYGTEAMTQGVLVFAKVQ